MIRPNFGDFSVVKVLVLQVLGQKIGSSELTQIPDVSSVRPDAEVDPQRELG